jgi:outer membrane cobalamin receptor
MDRILPISQVFMTERGETSTNIGNAIVGGDTAIKTDGTTYTVYCSACGSNGMSYTATNPTRTDADGDGFFAEVDPNDSDSSIIPASNGGYDPLYQP